MDLVLLNLDSGQIPSGNARPRKGKQKITGSKMNLVHILITSTLLSGLQHPGLSATIGRTRCSLQVILPYPWVWDPWF